MMPGQDPNEPYPGIRAALVLTLMALVASFFTTVALFGVGALAAYGIGRAIGVGAVATMAAQRVGEPQTERLGLRRLDANAIPLILCLVPAILLASELDNFAYDWAGDEPSVLAPLEATRDAVDSGAEAAANAATPPGKPVDDFDTMPAPDAMPTGSGAAPLAEGDGPPRLDLGEPAVALQAFIVMVGIIPIVDCFLFFGVIQQGLVRQLGLVRGVLLTGLFWMLLRDVPIVGITRFLIGSGMLLAMGALLGLVRTATGSILGPMFLASAWAAIQFVALALHGRTDLPGLNVDNTHLPVMVSLSSAAIVGWAAWTLYQEAERRNLESGEGGPQAGPGPSYPPNVRDLRPPDPD